MDSFQTTSRVAMRVRCVEIFYAVMTAGSVKRAADVLSITQPAATRLLQQAEASLGFALFDRVRGRLIATREAHLLFPEVEQIFLNLHAISRKTATLKKGGDETLRIHCVPSLSNSVLPEAIAKVKKKSPALGLSLHTAYSRQIEIAIALRECDVGITYEASTNPAVQCKEIGSGYLAAAGTGLRGPISMAALATLPIIDLDNQDPLGRKLSARRLSSDLTFQSVCTVESYQIAIALAAKKMGVAIVDQYTALSSITTHGLSVARIEPSIEFNVYALTPTAGIGSKSRGDVIEALTQALADPKWVLRK
jgi:DNA-binding transcriptional LysR family regulator